MQPYNPSAIEEERRPSFVLIMQDEWMLQTAIWFSYQSAWAIDITFKTKCLWASIICSGSTKSIGCGYSCVAHDVYE